MTVAELAEALSNHLTTVLPPGVVVRARDENVTIHGRVASKIALGKLVNDGSEDRLSPAELEHLTHAVLNQVQDVVSEETGWAWPGTHRMPVPYVIVEQARIRLGYGDPTAPALSLPDIPVSK